MKQNTNHDSATNSEPRLMTVIFEFTHPTATTVCVAGTFNGWQPEAKPMRHFGDGHWHKETALAPGIYEYCLVVDGQWIEDPLAKESVPNPFGGRNSLLKVAHSLEALHLADAENLPLKNSHA
ncbi:MAG: glycogen-binding domain-containing protein [Verrucomicrobia bacterium]|nr:glycogen-binding domain-containing protein [Verrucomicrobiota bacterium]